ATAVLVGAGKGRGTRLRYARAELRAGARSERQADRHVHVDLAARSARDLAHRVRQGQRSLRLREEPVVRIHLDRDARASRSAVLSTLPVLFFGSSARNT